MQFAFKNGAILCCHMIVFYMQMAKVCHPLDLQKLCTKLGVHPAALKSAWCVPAHTAQVFVPAVGTHPSLVSSETHADAGAGGGAGAAQNCCTD